MVKINREEYEVLKSLNNKWNWVARDNSRARGQLSELLVYQEKPHKYNGFLWTTHRGCDELPEHLFQFIKWENEEPYKIAELIEEYKYSAEHVSHVVNERVKALGKAWSESEGTEVKKDKEWLKKELEKVGQERLKQAENSKSGWDRLKYSSKATAIKETSYYVNQLDEPETLSQEWIEENSYDPEDYGIAKGKQVMAHDLKNLLVPKQEESTDEPETVASVLANFWKATKRVKEVLNMEVEELEE